MSTVLSDPTAPGVRYDPDELRVARLRAVRGPNFWRLAPVIACDLTLGSLENVPSTAIPGFNERLMEMLPTLRDHPCSRGTEAGSWSGWKRERTWRTSWSTSAWSCRRWRGPTSPLAAWWRAATPACGG